jgi:hypothetical protein
MGKGRRNEQLILPLKIQGESKKRSQAASKRGAQHGI